MMLTELRPYAIFDIEFLLARYLKNHLLANALIFVTQTGDEV